MLDHDGYWLSESLAIAEYLRKQFPATDRLFVTGCSAGGAGSLINYYFFRNTIDAQRGYMMDDSGPIFPSDGYSLPLPDASADLVFTHIAPTQTVLWVDVDTMIGGAVEGLVSGLKDVDRPQTIEVRVVRQSADGR